MAIPKHELDEMNRLIEGGKHISQVWEIYPKYDYLQIYNEVNDYSLLGKKRMITNLINKVRKSKSKTERDDFLDTINELVSGIYELTKKNGKKLVEINKITTS